MNLDNIVQFIQQGFLDVLTTIVSMISALIGVLPNPDPFPAMLDDMERGGNEAFTVAVYWLGQFVDIPGCVVAIETWFLMFATAWLIMTVWKWAKAR